MSSRIEYEAYWHKDDTDEEFNNINPTNKEVLERGKGLCEAAQKNLGAGIFIDAEFHTQNEKKQDLYTWTGIVLANRWYKGSIHFHNTLKKGVI